MVPKSASPFAAACCQTSGRSCFGWRGKGCLESDQRRDLTRRNFARMAITVEVVRSCPLGSEPLDRLYAMMIVGGVHAELTKRGKDTLLAERSQGQVVVDTLETGNVQCPVRKGGQLAEGDPLRFQLTVSS